MNFPLLRLSMIQFIFMALPTPWYFRNVCVFVYVWLVAMQSKYVSFLTKSLGKKTSWKNQRHMEQTKVLPLTLWVKQWKGNLYWWNDVEIHVFKGDIVDCMSGMYVVCLLLLIVFSFGRHLGNVIVILWPYKKAIVTTFVVWNVDWC